MIVEHEELLPVIIRCPECGQWTSSARLEYASHAPPWGIATGPLEIARRVLNPCGHVVARVHWSITDGWSVEPFEKQTAKESVT